MTYQELFAQAKALAEKAVVFAGEGKMEEYEKAIAESEVLRERAEGVKKAFDLSASFDTPVLPVQLPTDESDSPTLPGNEPKPVKVDPVEEMNKSIYTLRYGDESSAIKAVLRDLHGPSYESKRLRQVAGFAKYLRNYKDTPIGEEYELMREIILTPEYALKAIETGQDIKNLKAVMVEGIDDLGGYVVPIDFQVDVIRRIAGLTVMRGRATIKTTSRDKVEIPKLTGGDDQYTTAVRVTWVSETPTAGTADTNLTWGLESIPVHDMMAETFLSRNVVADSAVDLVAELTQAFAEASAIDEDNQFLTGDGNGKPDGILTNGTTPATGVLTVNSGNATGITADGLLDLEYEIPTQYRSNCIYITARRSVREFRQLKDGNGQYLWLRPQISGEPANFDGFPIAEQEAMPAIAASAYPILFGDPQGYAIVDRIGMTVERYLDSSTARQNQVLYLMRRRLGGKLINPERWAAQLISV